MNIPKFTRKKNRIIFDIISMTLVPENFIKDMEITAEMVSNMNDYVGYYNDVFEPGEVYLNTDLCPYCHYFIPLNRKEGCYKCPLYEGGEGCLEEGSSYRKIKATIKALQHSKRVLMQRDLALLAEEFVEANKDKLGEIYGDELEIRTNRVKDKNT